MDYNYKTSPPNRWNMFSMTIYQNETNIEMIDRNWPDINNAHKTCKKK